MPLRGGSPLAAQAQSENASVRLFMWSLGPSLCVPSSLTIYSKAVKQSAFVG